MPTSLTSPWFSLKIQGNGRKKLFLAPKVPNLAQTNEQKAELKTSFIHYIYLNWKFHLPFCFKVFLELKLELNKNNFLATSSE